MNGKKIWKYLKKSENFQNNTDIFDGDMTPSDMIWLQTGTEINGGLDKTTSKLLESSYAVFTDEDSIIRGDIQIDHFHENLIIFAHHSLFSCVHPCLNLYLWLDTPSF